MKLFQHAAIATILCGFAPNVFATTHIVTQSGFGFTPQDINIQLGDTVRWVWGDGGHTVSEGNDGLVNGDEAFHSDLDMNTTIFEVTFDALFVVQNSRPGGLYEYYCEPHFPIMIGTVTVQSTPPGTAFCFGDNSLPTDCPCALPNIVPNPSGAPDAGCANAFNLQGARLLATGTVTPDTINFQVWVANAYSGFGFLVKGNAQDLNGITNGDGVRCVAGALVRFGAHNAGTNGAPSGFWTYPNTVQTIAVSSATLQSPGQNAWYQFFYRNTTPSFCSAGTTNWSSGYNLIW
ncbi:MAG: plastocyanin/azurin family copper-binding protein [Planctomycetota bacterium]